MPHFELPRFKMGISETRVAVASGHSQTRTYHFVVGLEESKVWKDIAFACRYLCMDKDAFKGAGMYLLHDVS